MKVRISAFGPVELTRLFDTVKDMLFAVREAKDDTHSAIHISFSREDMSDMPKARRPPRLNVSTFFDGEEKARWNFGFPVPRDVNIAEYIICLLSALNLALRIAGSPFRYRLHDSLYNLNYGVKWGHWDEVKAHRETA